MASNLEALQAEYAAAKERLDELGAEIQAYDSPEEKVQRQLCREEWIVRWMNTSAHSMRFWEELAALAASSKEDWVFERSALEHDGFEILDEADGRLRVVK